MKNYLHTLLRASSWLLIFSCFYAGARTVNNSDNSAKNLEFESMQNSGTCSDPIPIQCGASISGNLRNGTNNITSYGRGNSNLNGVEIVYAIQVSEPSFVEFNLTNLTANADMIIFSDCNDTSALETGVFRRGTRDERAIANLDGQNIYYIAIEAGDESIVEGEYTLSVNCTPFCNSSNGLVETFDSGQPTDWQFNISGTGNPAWRFGNDAFGVGVDNAGSGNWASFDDFALGDGARNNLATAISPVVNLSAHENIRLFFDYGFDESTFVRGDQTRLSITDGTRTYYWNGNQNSWTTQRSPWLDDDDSMLILTADAMFNELIPVTLDTSRLSVTIEYDDGNGARSGWGFGFDNFILCGESTTNPSGPIVEFVTPNAGSELVEGDDLPVVITATDDGSIANVELFLNGTFVRRENFAPYEWAASGQSDNVLRNLAAGTYTLRVVATDNDGNTGERTITVIVSGTNSSVSGSYDFGTSTSPLEDGFTRVHPGITTGAFRWVDNSGLNSRDRLSGVSASNLNRDFIFSRSPKTFEVDVPNGTYNVTVTFGDRRFRHDNQQVSAENGQVVEGNITTNAGQFIDRSFLVTISDGTLSLEFSDQGGSNPDWTVTGFSFNQTSSNLRTSVTKNTKLTQSENVILGPNPVKDRLFIDNLPKGLYDIAVYSLEGNQVMRQKITVQQNQYQFDVPLLNTGLYIVRISNGEFIMNKKILIRN